MDRTKIEWADASWNPIRARNRDTGKIGWFCTHVSPGCGDSTGGGCYAETLNRRLGTGIDYRAQDLAKIEIFLDEKMLTQPLRWRRPRRIFVGSMTDLFGEFVPDAMLDCIYAVMALCPQHKFLLLTKRAGRMRDYITTLLHNPGRVAARADRMQRGGPHTPQWLSNAYQWPKSPSHEPLWPLENCCLGVSVEDQRRADERIPELLATPAAVRFVSYEPALEAVDFQCCGDRFEHPIDALFGRSGIRDRYPDGGRGGIRWTPRLSEPALDWVICGGESGPGARPFNIEWARSVIAQCKAAAVPCFVKQLGAAPYIDPYRGSNFVLTDRKGGDISEWPEDLRVREYPERGDG